MARHIFSICIFLLIGFNVTVYGQDEINDAIVDIERACQLSENEASMIDAMIRANTPSEINFITKQKDVLTRLNESLLACKTKLQNVHGYEHSSSFDSKSDFASCHEVAPTPGSRSLNYIKTGCDWFIRFAGVIWALQTFYGLIF